MAAIERKTKRYPSDLTDEEWDRIAPLLPKPSRRGRKPSVAMREVLNAILTYLAEGTPLLPADRYLHAKTMQWLFFEQYYVEPVIGSLRYWTLTGKLDRHAGMVDSRRKMGRRALDTLERELATTAFLVGSDFTIADIAVYAYGHRAEDAGFALAGYPAVPAWIARATARIGPGYPVHPYGIDPRSAACASAAASR